MTAALAAVAELSSSAAAISNGKRWRLTAAATSMGAAVEPATRRCRRRCGTSSGSYLRDDSSVCDSSRIIISSSNGKQQWQMAAAASMGVAVEPIARCQCSTSMSNFLQMTAALAEVAGSSSTVAIVDGSGGWEQRHPRKLRWSRQPLNQEQSGLRLKCTFSGRSGWWVGMVSCWGKMRRLKWQKCKMLEKYQNLACCFGENMAAVIQIL